MHRCPPRAAAFHRSARSEPCPAQDQPVRRPLRPCPMPIPSSATASSCSCSPRSSATSSAPIARSASAKCSARRPKSSTTSTSSPPSSRRTCSGKEIYVTFYGGEPTLNARMMKAVMRALSRVPLPAADQRHAARQPARLDAGEAFQHPGFHRRRRADHRRLPRPRHLAPGDQERATMCATASAAPSRRASPGADPDTSFEELDELATAVEAFDYLYFQFVADEMYARRFGRQSARPCWLKLMDKFFASDRYALSVHSAHGHRAQQGAADARAGTVRGPDAVPRVHAPDQRHAERPDLSRVRT